MEQICKLIEDIREEGIKEGMKKRARTTALRMLADGTLAPEKIAEYVDISPDEVKKLQKGQYA